MRKIILFMLCCAGLFPAVAQVNLAEDRHAFDPQLTYDQAIPSPESFLGYKLGEDMTLYASVVDYFKTLDAASDKITMKEYGRTYENRPLYLLVVTSADNHRNLEAIRQEHLKLTDPAALPAAEAERIVSNGPVFLSMSYNIHGNEFSSTEAAMQVVYRLAAAQDAATRNLLEHAVINLYICINADGRDRYAYWYKSVARHVPAPEPNDLDHSEPWPVGRTNHYWFDLNRDWVWGVHPELRGLTAEYQRWMPQIHVDYHEQGYNSNYFTMPGTTPKNMLLPDNYEAWSDTFGRANIAAFDRHRVNYFTRDAFDFFYPGYGSSYPSVQGAIGMLTEQGGIGGGRAVMTEEGTVQTLRSRIFDHYTTSIATLMKGVERRQQLLRYSYEAWNPAKSKSAVKAYVFPAAQGGYLEDVMGILLRHNIRVDRASADFALADARDYRSGKPTRKSFGKGDYIVFADQPRHLLLNSILERNMEFRDSVQYDISAWAAPLAYNLEAYSVNQKPAVRVEPLNAVFTIPGSVQNAGAAYAYVMDWGQRAAPKALGLFWQKGYNVRTAAEPFGDGKTRYSAGSIILLRGANEDKATRIDADVRDIAQKTGVRIEGHNTGRMLDGWDLAASRNRPVKRPKVALLVDPPFDMYSCGQIYHLFDWETELPVERIRLSTFKQTTLPKFDQRYGLADLKNYDVLIMPGGGGFLPQVFGEEQLRQFRAWIEAGGVLIATESAAAFFTEQRSKFSKIKLVEPKRDSSDAAKYLKYTDRDDFGGKQQINGAVMNARIDVTHPLAFGVKPDLYSIKTNAQAFEPSPELNTVGYYDKDPKNLLIAGYAAEKQVQMLARKTFAGVMPIGFGKLVLLADNTQFRMFWRGPSRMMQNAVMLLPGFNAPARGY
jgi:Zinc carboxypeptidase